MTVSRKTVEAAYQRHARNYDLAVRLYRLAGLRIEHYRARAVELLQLRTGDRVLDLGCGTGLNFPHLVERIGPEGELTGIDLSSEMLACAQSRVDHARWSNVKLVHADIAAFGLPGGINGVLATGVFGYLDERSLVLEAIAGALAPGGRLAIVDGKRPTAWPAWLFRLFVRISVPFGLTEGYFDARTWESVESSFEDTTFEEGYGGLLYIASGRAPATRV
jgi:demethylmenaquinone methyltransferase/2-methoxy-6-polyprenyl-1,4-benzoquinol methylase